MTLLVHAKNAAPAFQLKGGIYTLTTLELHQADESVLKDQLTAMVSKAPRFFQQTPVILALDKLPQDAPHLNLVNIRHLLHESGLLLIAIHGGGEEYKKESLVNGIAWLPPQRQKPKSKPNQAPEDLPTAKNIVRINPKVPVKEEQHTSSEPLNLEQQESRIINRPIRSGQQVYSPGDLIILGQVSTGAELIAGGHIHVYGPLRGRALAGVNGNKSARIFSTRFEAELVSICGQYKLPGKTPSRSWANCWGKGAQIILKDSNLHISGLS